MERKVGEIFEFGGEWYQCVEELSWGVHCNGCDFLGRICSKLNPKCSPVHHRSDGKSVIFKKLEKVGGTFACRNMSLGCYGIIVQRYKVFAEPILTDNSIKWCDSTNETILIALINKQDMEEKNLKPFDLEAAKAGKPVCTRDGRKARIICFDAKGKQPIIALIALFEGEKADEEIIQTYSINGGYYEFRKEDHRDLMMLPEKKEGWVVIRKGDIYETKELAEKELLDSQTAIMIRKISWEE